MYKSHFLYQYHTQKLVLRLICKVQVFSGLITNCNHKLSSRWSHITAASFGCGAKQAFQRQNETEIDGLNVYKRQGADKRWQPEETQPIHGDHMGKRV